MRQVALYYTTEDLVLASIEKHATHPSIKNFKSNMNGINSNFSFKFVNRDQTFNEIKKLGENKASQTMISQLK